MLSITFLENYDTTCYHVLEVTLGHRGPIHTFVGLPISQMRALLSWQDGFLC
jgi:hypothetical protein